jgi:hypothetical protein
MGQVALERRHGDDGHKFLVQCLLEDLSIYVDKMADARELVHIGDRLITKAAR